MELGDNFVELFILRALKSRFPQNGTQNAPAEGYPPIFLQEYDSGTVISRFMQEYNSTRFRARWFLGYSPDVVRRESFCRVLSLQNMPISAPAGSSFWRQATRRKSRPRVCARPKATNSPEPDVYLLYRASKEARRRKDPAPKTSPRRDAVLRLE
jgi:hypothetical protein